MARRILVLVTLALVAGPSSLAVRSETWEGFVDWSPDGRWILIARDMLSDDTMSNWVVAPTGKGARRVAGNWSDRSWSPDGRHIAWSTQSIGGRQRYPQIIVTEADGRHRRQLTRGRAAFVAPQWAPDGRSISYLLGGRKTLQLWSMRADGSGKRPLAPPGPYAGSSSWSPDGEHILFVACFRAVDCRGKIGDLYVSRRDGSRRRRLARGVAPFDYHWSPDGRWISFVYPDARTRLAVVRPDGTGHRVVDFDLGLGSNCGWSPDGRRILFEEGSPLRLRTMKRDGSDRRLLLRETRARDADDFCGDWSPDGRWIAFTRGGNGTRIFLVRPNGTGLHRLLRR